MGFSPNTERQQRIGKMLDGNPDLTAQQLMNQYRQIYGSGIHFNTAKNDKQRWKVARSLAKEEVKAVETVPNPAERVHRKPEEVDSKVIKQESEGIVNSIMDDYPDYSLQQIFDEARLRLGRVVKRATITNVMKQRGKGIALDDFISDEVLQQAQEVAKIMLLAGSYERLASIVKVIEQTGGTSRFLRISNFIDRVNKATNLDSTNSTNS